MKDFLDRQPINAGRRKITYEDGRSEFVTVEMADEATVEGTALNREAFMALQGFQSANTEFMPDGSIVETNSVGDTLTTTFPAGSISLEVFTSVTTGISISKRTYEENGLIKEEVLDGACIVS